MPQTNDLILQRLGIFLHYQYFSLIGESEDEVYQGLVRHKRKDKTLEQYFQYLVGGITIGIPEKFIKGLNEYIDVGVSNFIIHFIELNMQTLKLFESEVISKI
jgi:hypothetical protein